MKFSYFLFLSILVFSSCGKNNIGDWDKKDYNKDKCFEFIYPISYLMPDDTSISGGSQEEIDNALKTWYNANDSKEKPTLELPISLLYKDGHTFTVKIEDDWKIAKEDCTEDKCFDFVYPLSYTMPDGTILTGDNKESLGSQMKTWYTNNDSEEKATLTLPVNLVYKDGKTFTVNNEEDWITAKADCK